MTRALPVLGLLVAALLGLAACGERPEGSGAGSRGAYVGGSGGINLSR